MISDFLKVSIFKDFVQKIRKMRKLSLLICICCLVSENVTGQTISGGMKIPSEEGFNSLFLSPPRAGASLNRVVPDKVDLSDYMPKPGDQLGQASCAGWAIAYGLKSFHEAVKGGYKMSNIDVSELNSKTFSPAFIFNQVHDRNTPCNEGVLLADALRFLQRTGVVKWEEMPYVPEDCQRAPDLNSIGNAKRYSISQFTPLYYINQGDPDIKAFKTALATGYPDTKKGLPIVVGVHLDARAREKDFDIVNLEGQSIKIWRQFVGGTALSSENYHAMLCVGYNNSIKAFKFLNSWGAVGHDGYLWLSEEVVKRAVKEAYTTDDLIQTRNEGNDRNMLEIDRQSRSAVSITPLVAGIESEGLLASGKMEFESYKSSYKGFDNLANHDTIIVETKNVEALKQSNFVVTSWFKKGYYRDFDNFRLGLYNIVKRRCCVIVRFTDTKTGDEVAKFTATYGQEVFFSYNKQNFIFSLDKIKIKGFNPFKRAAYFTFSRIYANTKYD